MVIAFGGALAFVWTMIAKGKQERENRELERQLSAQRARLDQLDRVHSRRVQQIETLYGTMEDACGLCFDANPRAEIKGREELDKARRAFRQARIYLDDVTADVCVKLLETCREILNAAERVKDALHRNAKKSASEHMDKAKARGETLLVKLCSSLQVAIGAVATNEKRPALPTDPTDPMSL